MKRLVYTPKVEAFVKLDDAERQWRTVDLTDDIISGDVTLRLNAVSEATLTLQNKAGKYTQKAIIRPMDRIIIRMSRVGQPFLVFSGYVDEAPYYQLYPGPVTIRCSSTLKLLQYTYFDPGLPFLTTYFLQFGWAYDPSTGILSDAPSSGGGPSGGGMDGTFGKFDVFGGIHKVLEHVLIDVGGWDENAISILDIPVSFLKNINGAMNKDLTQVQQDEQQLLTHLKQLFGAGGAGSVSSDLTGSANPLTGNITPARAAKIALDAGFKDQQAVVAVAIAMAESSLKTDNIGHNQDGSYDFGLWQINTVHSGVSPYVEPYGNNPRPVDPKKVMATLQPFMMQMFDPNLNAKQAYAISNHGTDFSPWYTYDGAPPHNGSYRTHLAEAQTAVAAAALAQGGFDPTVTTTTTTVATRPSTNTSDFSVLIEKTATFKGVDQGIDFTGPGNIFALADGTITRIGGAGSSTWPGDGAILVYSIAGGKYIYVAEDFVPAKGLKVGSTIKKGQVIGRATGSGHAPGIEVGWATSAGIPVAPLPPPRPASQYTIQGDDFKNFVLNGSSSLSGTSGTNLSNTGIAMQAAWFTLQLQGNDYLLSTLLTGQRAIANDIPLLTWISSMCQASARVFTTMPDGTFLAFFPDRFGYFGTTPYFNISDVELLDFTVQRNDQNLTTHVFANGSYFGAMAGTNWADKVNAPVASIESEAFPWFINLDYNDPQKLSPKDFNPVAFMQKYGARPFNDDLPDVRHPVLLWMAAWMKFVELWAKQYQATATMTFMPELQPGGLVQIANSISMFIEGVTHSFDRAGGFTTTADLSSPASLKSKSAQNPGLPIAGGRFTDPTYLDSTDPANFSKDLPNG